jgi:F-type H+-transporting ATPase subunit alpha
LKQDQYAPYPVEEQVAIIFAATHGYLDAVPTKQVKRYETEMLNFFKQKYPNVLKDIREKQALKDDVKKPLVDALEEFKSVFEAK